MTHTIELTNGSGWNNYTGLRNLTSMPRGTKGLMKNNGVATLTVGPADPEKPFGIAARYYDEDGDILFTQRFDQNDTAEWIKSAITELLTKTIAVRREERRAEITAEELRAAKRAGFDTIEAHRAHRAAEESKAKEEAHAVADARKAWLSGQNGGSEAAAKAIEEMRRLRREFPAANTITRKGKLARLRVCEDGSFVPAGYGLAEQFAAEISDLEAMKAWLFQNGRRPGVDDRQYFFDAAK